MEKCNLRPMVLGVRSQKEYGAGKAREWKATAAGRGTWLRQCPKQDNHDFFSSTRNKSRDVITHPSSSTEVGHPCHSINVYY